MSSEKELDMLKILCDPLSINILKVLKDSEEKLNVSDIGRKLDINYTISRKLSSLESEGLIKRELKHYNRENHAMITEKGEKFLNIASVTYNSLKEL